MEFSLPFESISLFSDSRVTVWACVSFEHKSWHYLHSVPAVCDIRLKILVYQRQCPASKAITGQTQSSHRPTKITGPRKQMPVGLMNSRRRKSRALHADRVPATNWRDVMIYAVLLRTSTLNNRQNSQTVIYWVQAEACGDAGLRLNRCYCGDKPPYFPRGDRFDLVGLDNSNKVRRGNQGSRQAERKPYILCTTQANKPSVTLI